VQRGLVVVRKDVDGALGDDRPAPNPQLHAEVFVARSRNDDELPGITSVG